MPPRRAFLRRCIPELKKKLKRCLIDQSPDCLFRHPSWCGCRPEPFWKATWHFIALIFSPLLLTFRPQLFPPGERLPSWWNWKQSGCYKIQVALAAVCDAASCVFSFYFSHLPSKAGAWHRTCFAGASLLGRVAELRQRLRVPTHVCLGIGLSLVSNLEILL